VGVHVIEQTEYRRLSLRDYVTDARYVSLVSALEQEASYLRPLLEGRTLWMVNSTAAGGGVAEMLPRLCGLLRELGVAVEWAVIRSDRPEFFRVTKRVHNLIHDDTRSGVQLGAAEAAVLEAVNRENAASLKPRLRPQDILIVHDPQPLPLGQLLRDAVGVRTIWQCHIGLDQRTEATGAAWRFLRPYLEAYDYTIFSVPEYIPSFLAGRAAIIPPALDPLSHKNRDLLVHKLVGILCASGLQTPHEPVPAEPFATPALRVLPDGARPPGEVGLLFRPIVMQVSRWDRLKGWAPLLDGFLRLKQSLVRRAGLEARRRRRVELARLVLAGADPTRVADDPEGVEVFRELVARIERVEPRLREDIVLLQLPMASRKENALIVNALQRCASVLVQNSLREGFGLTVTEGMWKGLAVLGSSACGIRHQIRHGVDGLITRDPEDPDEIAEHLLELLGDDALRFSLGKHAQLRVFDELLVFRQISRYLQLVASLLQPATLASSA